MQSYLISYLMEDESGLGFGYKVFDQYKKINAENILNVSAFLKEYEKTDTLIILSVINLTNGI